MVPRLVSALLTLKFPAQRGLVAYPSLQPSPLPGPVNVSVTMEEKRAKTMEALSTFIESQKALLAQTRTDITRLRELRSDIAKTPEDMCSLTAFGEKLNELGGIKLSVHPDVIPALPRELDWAVFTSADATPLRNLATASRTAYAQQRRPSTKQTSPLSDLQQLVKSHRAAMVDPVLASFPPLSSDEEEEPPDPEEIRRIQEREKIRELKRRKVFGDAAAPFSLSGLGLRKVDAVFVRRDQEDESAEVDIGLGDVATTPDIPVGTSVSSPAQDVMDVDTPATSLPPSMPGTPIAEHCTPSTSSHSGRSRRVSQRAAQSRKQASHPPKKKALPPPPEPETMPPREAEGPLLDKKGKPRPETYKQAWSVSEQHLLERLLEEIPDGEKNRWAKISQAMNGRRTARQVASRVQKYYEKLKRFGVDVGNNASSRANSN